MDLASITPSLIVLVILTSGIVLLGLWVLGRLFPGMPRHSERPWKKR
jgi:hypothetical protein